MEKYTKKFEKLEKSAVKLTLTFSAAAVDEDYRAQLAKYSKELTLNGFRKGKAPAALIESKFGESILSESFTAMLDKAVGEVFTPADEKDAVEKEFKPIDSRALDLINEDQIFPIKKGQDIVCEIKYDVYPQFELGQYTGLKVEYSADDFDEEVEKNELEALRNRNAMIENKGSDTAEVADIATVDMVEIGEDGAEIEETKKDDYVFTLAETPAAPYELDAEICGMKIGEIKSITREYGEGSPYAGQKKTYKVELKKLKVRTLPELDDDFAEDVDSKYKTIEDLKKGLHEKAMNDYNRRVESVKVDAALAEIAKNTPVEVPQMLIDNDLEEKWYGFVQQFTQNGQVSFEDSEKRLASMGITKESYFSMSGERFAEENLLNIKKSLILEKIEEVEKTAETDEEKIAKFIADNNIDTKQYGEQYEELMKGQIREQLGKDNAIAFLMKNNEFIKVEPKAVAEEVKAAVAEEPKAEEPKAEAAEAPKAKAPKAKAPKAPKAEAEKADI